jgi:hypothetical protein
MFCSSLRDLLDAKKDTTMPKIVLQFGLHLCDAIFIMALATYCFKYIGREVRKAIKSGGEMSCGFLTSLDLFFLQVTKGVEEMCLQDSNVGVRKSDRPVILQPEDYRINKNLLQTWLSIAVGTTPNCLALFQATSLIRNHSEPDVVYPSPTRSPPSNRNLETRRLFSRGTTRSDNPGIMATFFGNVISKFDQSITNLEIVAFPFLLHSEKKIENKYVKLETRTVLAHLQSRYRNAEAESLFIEEVGVSDAVNLIRILDKVSLDSYGDRY